MLKVNKQLTSGFLAASIALGNLGLPVTPMVYGAEAGKAIEIFVSPTGKDTGKGTIDDPLQSLEAAKAKVLELNKSGKNTNGITVNLREGVYSMLESSFELGKEDSGKENAPIVYQSYPGEKAVISGSVQAKGSDFEKVTDQKILDRLPQEVQDKVLVYDITEHLGISEFSPIPKNGFNWPDQAAALNITVDGKAQTLARYPNEGFIEISNIQESGFVPRSHMTNPDGTCPECSTKNGKRMVCEIGEKIG